MSMEDLKIKQKQVSDIATQMKKEEKQKRESLRMFFDKAP